MAWTEQMVEDLKKMWHEGLTTGEIGKRLGVSKTPSSAKFTACSSPDGRPRLRKKDEIFEEKAVPAKPAKEEKAAPVKAKEEKRPEPAKEEKFEPVAKMPVKSSHSHCGKTSLTDLDNHTCRWPVGDPKDENFHFCGKKVKIGQTYCEEHANIAYVKAGKK